MGLRRSCASVIWNQLWILFCHPSDLGAAVGVNGWVLRNGGWWKDGRGKGKGTHRRLAEMDYTIRDSAGRPLRFVDGDWRLDTEKWIQEANAVDGKWQPPECRSKPST